MGEHVSFRIFVLIAMVLSVGCTDVSPTVGMLKSIDGFEFVSSDITTSSLFSVTLQATCPAYINTVEMSFDGSNWIKPSDYDSNTKSVCENGAFLITLSDSKTPWKNTNFVRGQAIKVKFRAILKLGPAIVREVQITYKPSPFFTQEILAGAAVQTGIDGGTGQAYKLRGKIRAQQQDVASGGAYRIKGRIVQ